MLADAWSGLARPALLASRLRRSRRSGRRARRKARACGRSRAWTLPRSRARPRTRCPEWPKRCGPRRSPRRDSDACGHVLCPGGVGAPCWPARADQHRRCRRAIRVGTFCGSREQVVRAFAGHGSRVTVDRWRCSREAAAAGNRPGARCGGLADDAVDSAHGASLDVAALVPGRWPVDGADPVPRPEFDLLVEVASVTSIRDVTGRSREYSPREIELIGPDCRRWVLSAAAGISRAGRGVGTGVWATRGVSGGPFVQRGWCAIT